MSKSIKKIIVVGADVDAWMTAFFLKTEFSKAYVEMDVELIEVGTSITEHDTYTVLPSHRALHAALGANDEKLRESTNASLLYAQRYTGWGGRDKEFFLPFDSLGKNILDASFFQCWLRGVNEGLTTPLDEFSLGAAAAKHSKYIADSNPGNLQPPAYGYHLNAIPYVYALANAAIAIGVKHRNAQINNVVIESGIIKQLILNDGSVAQGDFYIDASGEKEILIDKFAESNFEDWSHWFKCDRTIVSSSKKTEKIPGFSQITAFSTGWYGIYPRTDRMAIQIQYASAFGSAEDALIKVQESSGLRLTDALERKTRYGVRHKPWIGNCLAMGSAAASIDSLDAASLKPLVIGLSLLREYFPQDSSSALEPNFYNQKFSSHIQRLRDFQLSHYVLNKRINEPFWDTYRNLGLSSELNDKIELFKRRGIVSLCEEEIFDEDSWIYLLVGAGVKPMHYDPYVNTIPTDVLVQKMNHALRSIKEVISISVDLN